MNRRKAVILILILAVLMGIFLYYFSHSKDEQKKYLVLYGNVDVRQVDLSFRVSGRVNKIYFEEGDFVKEGSLVGILDKQPYLDQVHQAEASIQSIRSSLKNAEILFNRRNELIKDGSIAQEDLDNALSNRNVLESNLANAEAALAVAKTNLSFTEVYAPTDGIILTRILEPGSVVNPGNPIYTLSIISPVWVRAYVSEPELGLIHPGMSAEIYTDTKGAHPYHGKIGFISPVAEFTPKTVETTQLRTDLVYRIRVYADNPDQGLRQGMPVTVKMKTNS